MILHFTHLSGLIFRFWNRFYLFTEEEGRFGALGLGLRAPTLGIELRSICAVLNRRDHLNCRARLSVLMRDSTESVSSHFLSRSVSTGRLHLTSIFHRISTDLVDSFCAHVREFVISILLHSPSYLSHSNTWKGRNRLGFVSPNSARARSWVQSFVPLVQPVASSIDRFKWIATISKACQWPQFRFNMNLHWFIKSL